MKVLFICFANVARSQIAEAYFKTLSQHDYDSAGVAVDYLIEQGNLPSRKLKDVPYQRPIDYIKQEFGLDISEKERQQLVPEMLKEADLAVVIVEEERWPHYLKENGKVIFWDIPDPFGQADDFANELYSHVQQRVEELVARIG